MFISLLVIGLVFRFLFMYYQGLSNDELSAWKRTEFNDWNAFWQLGVKAGDMHPVFYQALLWGWVRIFGDSELALRSTSILFYTLNSWLIYRISVRFFSKQVGLAVIALYAGLAFTIINSVFARPYNSGTFFLLLLVWSIFEMNVSQRKFSWWTVGIVLGFLGAMLSHYFAFLTAGVIGLLALFYVDRGRIKEILICGVVSILLFLPHWPVTKFQLSQGGLGWLGAPEWNWLLEFFDQFFNYSGALAVFFIALFIFSLLRGAFYKSHEEKFVLRIFLLTYITGHLVSIFYTPVLRELVMLYTLPFLFLYLFRGFQFSSGTRFSRGLIVLPVLLGIHSIWHVHLLEPKNFGVFREIGEVVNTYEPKLGQQNIEFASSFNNISYINYYYNKDVAEPIADWSSPETVYALADRARDSKKDYFIYNWSNHFHLPIYYEVIRRQYPYVIHHRDYFNSASTIYSRKPATSPGLQKKAALVKMENTFPETVTSEEEFIGAIYVSVGELRKSQEAYGYNLVEAAGRMEETAPFYLVVTLERDGQTIMQGEYAMLYAAYDQSRLLESGKDVTFFTAFSAPEKALDTDLIHIYFWNPEKQKVTVNKPKILSIPLAE